jgi:hypothetical protein
MTTQLEQSLVQIKHNARAATPLSALPWRRAGSRVSTPPLSCSTQVVGWPPRPVSRSSGTRAMRRLSRTPMRVST